MSCRKDKTLFEKMQKKMKLKTLGKALNRRRKHTSISELKRCGEKHKNLNFF